MRKKIRLVEPSIAYKDQITNYKQEFIDENIGIDGGGGLLESTTIEEYLKLLKNSKNSSTVPIGKVSSNTFIAITEDNELVGIINIRHSLNKLLINLGGHIGYSIRKSERQKGYATEMLRLALLKCKPYGIDKALVTCRLDNIGSAKTILNNGGVFEDERTIYDISVKRFWITVD